LAKLRIALIRPEPILISIALTLLGLRFLEKKLENASPQNG
jgi:hypothetical protein